jgi:hypothetical protein
MTNERILLAASNNALWCDAMCQAHGLATEFRDSLWLTTGKTPRFYPNVVSMEDRSAELLAVIGDLYARAKGLGAVKDSFASLELDRLGFTILFEASWLWHEAVLTSKSGPAGIRWGRVGTAAELEEWERAWDGGPIGGSGAEDRVFLPSLLGRPEIGFIAGYSQNQIVTGAIGYQTGEVVGLSNVFTPEADQGLCWAGCLGAVQALFQNRPVVDYEHGADLDLALAAGFERLRPLRVWVPPTG